MAIGNAPWPIGVTMVGIHARTGREKISSRNVAHVLNDETQRKYMQVFYEFEHIKLYLIGEWSVNLLIYGVLGKEAYIMYISFL